ncbi:MAG: T9SS type A sorting domain-containing protein [Ignavibacteriales bacterium]|nr:T9SS type A sorting domain-containing protein [Ignavibacteriales bacterium]
MMKRILSIFTVLVMFVSISNAQWTNQGAWPNASLLGDGSHGIAVDPDGKVWNQTFSPTKLWTGTDTIVVRQILVFNADGSPASFSPIWRGTINGVVDTLKGSNVRGMRKDLDGNILYVDGLKNMYRFNYKTGEMMNKVKLGDNGLATSPLCPAVDAAGNIFVGGVVAPAPVLVYDKDFNYLYNALDASQGYARTMEVSADGNTIYWCSYTLAGIYIYHRADEFSAYDSVGLIPGFKTESIVWHPVTKHLWASGGSWFSPAGALSATYQLSNNTWYELNLDNMTVTDSMKWIYTTPDSPDERPRAIDFSPDGKTAYVGCFGTSGYPLMQKIIYTGTGVEKVSDIVTKYELGQNYPNPFNPSTTIKFSVLETGLVTLKVYNTLGQEVATLLNEVKGAGIYETNFDASKLTSGTYIYTITTANFSSSRKMLLIK